MKSFSPTQAPLSVQTLLFSGLLLVCSVYAARGAGNTVINSKHDLSATAPGPIKAVSQNEICIFCHTPHHSTGQMPLWNHAMSSATYTPYSSSTMIAHVGQPSGASKLCLSCHDGTVALGQINNPFTTISMQNSVTTMPPGPSNLGTDLSTHHPTSFTYDAALASADGSLNQPSSLTNHVRLDSNSQVQCTSCHNPHNDQYGNFLVAPDDGSTLCLACHTIYPWQNSAHATRTMPLASTAAPVPVSNSANPKSGPARLTPKTTSVVQGCQSCHTSHGAETPARLLRGASEEQTCFVCHSSRTGSKDIASEFGKFSAHPVFDTARYHDAKEDPVNPRRRHVACSDCHNSHAATTVTAARTGNLSLSGALAGLTGINSAGGLVRPLKREYELCLRCHSDNAQRGQAFVTRQYVETNTRLQFSPSSKSYHPIMATGRNPTVPSLMPPWTPSSLIACTDCHNNDSGPATGGGGPRGPHGSVYAPLLERNLTTVDYQAENIQSYALCYKCHNRDSILADQSFSAMSSSGQPAGHQFHVVEQKTACSTCHSSHGVQTGSHLINFNTSYVTPASNGQLNYTSKGNGSGTCTLTCHGREHLAVSYPMAPLLPRAAQPRVRPR
jgi:predicted CXXCH cytochrome family protein